MITQTKTEVNPSQPRRCKIEVNHTDPLDTALGSLCEIVSPRWSRLPALYAYKGPDTERTGEAEYSFAAFSEFNAQRLKVAPEIGPDWLRVPKPLTTAEARDLYAATGIRKGTGYDATFYLPVRANGKAVHYLHRRAWRFGRDVLAILVKG